MKAPIEQFTAAIAAAGIRPPERIEADGKIHRFATSEKRRDNAGWYVLYDGGIPAGAFGCFRRVFSETWSADVYRELSAEEKVVHQDRLNALRREREAANAIAQAEAAARAAELWQEAAPAPDDHPYLMKKGIRAHGLRVRNRSLLVPMYDGTQLQSLQFIDTDGGKRFMKGGRVAGCYTVIGQPADVVCVAEGFATCASVHEATGFAVAVAFSAGNLLAVAQAMRAQHAAARMIVCADDDAHKEGNPGLNKAKVAAQVVGAALAIPDFGVDRPEGLTDFNDLHHHGGVEAVRRCVSAAMAVASSDVRDATVATDWPEPRSLDRDERLAEPFPIDALPDEIGAAVREYQAYGQQPISLVASSALAAVSLAAQGLADIARDERLRGPLSLNFLVIAQSGERKTAADRTFGGMLDEWQRDTTDAMREDIQRNRAAIDAWNTEQEGIRAQIKKAMSKGPAETEKQRRRLIEHALTKPAQLIEPRLRYEDVNPQSLAFALATGYPSAALWSDEAGMVTGSHGMGKESLLGFLTNMNRLWDGGAIHQDRKQAQSVHLEGRRLTVSLMAQPTVVRELVQRAGGLARGSGFLARYLPTAPLSTMGTRLYRPAPEGMPALAAFHRRIRKLLDCPLPLDKQGRLDPPLLQLSAGAFSAWREYHDAIERELRPYGEYIPVCDFAAKSAENAARIAGCLHVFQEAQGAVSQDTLQRAIFLARWYLGEALRVLDLLDEPQEWADARLLDGWLAQVGDKPARDVLHAGPGPLRNKKRRDAAIEVLKDLGRVRLERDGRRETLVRNPALRQPATATPATGATDRPSGLPTVAEVAAVAVAGEQVGAGGQGAGERTNALPDDFVRRLEAMAQRHSYTPEERNELLVLAERDPETWSLAVTGDEQRFQDGVCGA